MVFDNVTLNLIDVFKMSININCNLNENKKLTELKMIINLLSVVNYHELCFITHYPKLNNIITFLR